MLKAFFKYIEYLLVHPDAKTGLKKGGPETDPPNVPEVFRDDFLKKTIHPFL
jgi:hypothetical protein